MSSTPSPTWYDVLGVARDASPAEIKAAWREATDTFEPGSGRFRMFNDAAEVLLDPERRAAYDASLGAPAGAPADAPTDAPVDAAGSPTSVSAPPPPIESSTAGAGTEAGPAEQVEEGKTPGRRLRLPLPRRRPSAGTVTEPHDVQPPSRRLVAAAVLLAVLSVAGLGVAGWKIAEMRGEASVADARDDAPVAAEQAAKAVFSYDYRSLPADRKRAEGYLTGDFAEKYRANFTQLEEQSDGTPGLAVQSKTVVAANVLASGVVDAQEDKVRVLVYVNQISEKPDKDPQVFQNRVTLTMVREGDRWLVDNVKSY